MNKMKKALLLALSLAMSATLFAACGKDKGNGGNSSSESSSVESSSPVVDDSSEDVSSEDASSDGASSDSESQTPSEISLILSGKASIMEFETTTLEAIVMGAEETLTVTWKSSDDAVASVDENGVVTAHKQGSVTITASAGGVSATHALEITATTYFHEIEFDIAEVKMYDDGFEQVEASVVFNGETLDNDECGLVYAWEKVSGDDGIVTVETDGAIATFTAVSAGTVVYKVSTTARGYEIEKTITVTVLQNEYSYAISNEKITEVDGGYKTELTLVSDETLDIGTIKGVLNGEPTEDELTVEWTTASDVISVENGVITANKAGEGVITGTTSYNGQSLTITLTVSVVKHQATIEKTVSIEAITDKLDLTDLADAIKEDVKEVKIGDVTVFSGSAVAGEIALGARPVKAADLGKGKTMTIETDTTFYTLTADVYTMIIDNAEELDKWQEIAAENAVAAGLCIPEQKGLTYSGYFILGDDIEYNKVWKTYLPYAGNTTPNLWSLCYNNPNIYVDGKIPEYGKDEDGKQTTDIINGASGELKEGAIVEDWGAGKQGGFQGVFDGDGHYIDGLETKGQYSGFIITMGINGTIKNLAFTNAKIGAEAGLVANRGQGTLENIFVDVAAMESGVDGANWTHVVIRPGNNSVRWYNNIVVDLSKIDYANLKYAMVIGCAEAASNGVYVIGAKDALFARGNEGWVAGSNNTSSWNESQACIFYHYLEGNDVAGSFANTADLLGDATNGEIVKAWDSEMWTITDNVVIAKSVVDMYKTGALEITNSETKVNAGRSAIITTNKNKAYISFALKEPVEGISIVNNVVSVAEDVTIGTKFTVVATSLLDGTLVDEMEFTSAAPIRQLDYTTTVETSADTTITLPDVETLEGTINKVTVGSHLVYDSANGVGSIEGNVLTVGSMPVQMSDLGDGIVMTIDTELAKYEMPISVYTMVIDTAAELEQWYAKASDNALAAGLVIEAQKDFVLSGYFVLGADIEYNKVWKHLTYSSRWNACYANKEIWKDQSLYKSGTAPANDNLVDGAIVEDWGAGDKGGFRGVFDGKGHTIVGLELDGTYAGFIGTMGADGVLKNVAFTNVSLGSTTGIVERGNKGGLIENVYIEVDAIESGAESFNDKGEYNGVSTKVVSLHGKTKLVNVVVNVTDCDFTGVEYVYLLNLSYNEAENVYVIDRDYIFDTKTDFNTDSTPSGFWHHSANDKGASFATTEALLADGTHGAVVAGFGGYWKVEEGKLYFGDTQVVTASLRVVDNTEYKVDANKQVTLSNENLTAGSVWNMSIDGGEATEVTITEEGKLTIEIDPATVEGYQTKVVLSTEEMTVTFANVIVVQRFFDETEYTADANYQITVSNENLTADSVWTVYVNDVEAGEVTVTEEGKATVTIDPANVSGYQTSVVLRCSNKAIFFENVLVVKYIMTEADLRAIGMGENNTTATGNLTGYYKLGANITFTHQDDYSDVIAAGYHKAGANLSHLYSFNGIFDGNGYTIDNMRVADGGIFGYMENATVKNLTLTNVQVLDSVASTISKQGGGYASILAYAASNTSFTDINISVASYPSAFSWKRVGLFICDNGAGVATFENVTVDAAGLILKNILGIKHSKNVYEDVVIKAVDYYAIGYTGDSWTTAENTNLKLSKFPDGITFVLSNKIVARDSAYANKYVDYAGDVTALGFAAGTKVLQAGFVTENGWNDQYASRAKLSAIPAGYDYVDVQFALNQNTSFTLWDGVKASYTVTASSVKKADGVPYDRTIQILDASGNPISISAFAPNTVYTLRTYLKDTNGDSYVKDWQITATTSGTTCYFGNISFGIDENAPEEGVSGLAVTTTEENMTVTEATVDGVKAWKVVSDAASKPRAYIDATALAGKSTLTFSVYLENVDGEPLRIRAMVDGASETYKFTDVTLKTGWNELSVDLSDWDGMEISEFAFQLVDASTIYLKDIKVA